MYPESLSDRLALLRGNHSKFNHRVVLATDHATGGLARVRYRVYYVSCRDGVPTIEAFLNYLKWQLVYFCLPRRERANIQQQVLDDVAEGYEPMVRAYERARKLFINAEKKLSRSGECGELILRVFLEWALGAPQVVCKMNLKTSPEMPVHGTDGIHLGTSPDGNNLRVYWGESKLHKTFTSAWSSAKASLSAFATDPDRHEREVDIFLDNFDLGPEHHDLEDAIARYFDESAEESLRRQEAFACLLGFNTTEYEELVRTRDITAFEATIRRNADQLLTTIGDPSTDPEFASYIFEFFLIPFPSVDDLRAGFKRVINWS